MIEAIGIADQRETTPVGPRHGQAARQRHRLAGRTAMQCDQLKREGWDAHVAETTGLVINLIFSPRRSCWLLPTSPALPSGRRRSLLRRGQQLLLYEPDAAEPPPMS